MRWRCLSKRLDCKLEHVVDTVAACVTLHNMCEMIGDSFLDEWRTRQERNNTSEVHHSTPSSSTPSGGDVRAVVLTIIVMRRWINNIITIRWGMTRRCGMTRRWGIAVTRGR